METIDLNIFLSDINYYLKQAYSWKIFVYPTDTVYGIWSIIKSKCIDKIYDIKWREKTKSLSIVAPNVAWIKKFFVVPDNLEEIIEDYFYDYHGITLLLRKKDIESFMWISLNEKVWIRILKHPFQRFVEKLWEPFITTSANISWDGAISDLEFLDPQIAQSVDYIIDWWELYGKPSVIIDLEDWNVVVREK